MAALACPFCLVHANFSVTWQDDGATARFGSGVYTQAVYRCNNEQCRRLVVALTTAGRVVEYWPRVVGGKQFPDVPEQIASTADEAHQCLSIGAFRGAVALARAVVEATAKDHGVTKGLLSEKIKELAAQGIISSDMKDAADEIRFAGNEVAHGDIADAPMASDEAESILQLMDTILARVYQEPAQVAKVRAARLAKKTTPQAGPRAVASA